MISSTKHAHGVKARFSAFAPWRRQVLGATTLALALAWTGVGAQPERVLVLVLFKNRSMLEIDGTQRVLKAGQTSPEGVTLVSADSRGAVLSIDGVERPYALSSKAGGDFSAPQRAEVRIWRDTSGMFATVGSVNGVPIDLLVDTGANVVALSTGQARQLGIDFRAVGSRAQVRTASGMARAYHLELDKVQVGAITLHNVEAVVIEGRGPGRALLGMSFLSRVEMENRSDMLVLRAKF